MEKSYQSNNLSLNPGQRKPVVLVFQGKRTMTKKIFEHSLKGDTLTLAVKGKKFATMWAIGDGVK
jgi:hypothetical protein